MQVAITALNNYLESLEFGIAPRDLAGDYVTNVVQIAIARRYLAGLSNPVQPIPNHEHRTWFGISNTGIVLRFEVETEYKASTVLRAIDRMEIPRWMQGVLIPLSALTATGWNKWIPAPEELAPLPS